jgi:hypothetical protein
MDWLNVVGILTQKGANAAVIAISVKLIIIDADLKTEIGIKVAFIGAFLLAVGAIIEYLMWRDTANLLAGLNKRTQDILLDHLCQKK